MPFSSLLFVSVFLPAFLAVYWTAPLVLGGAARMHGRNVVALLFSVAFYAWGAPRFLPVVLALGVADFYLSHALDRAEDPGRRRRIVTAGVVMHLSTLAYFKYANFFVDQGNALGALVGLPKMPWSEVVLPIGISFITFEEISYLVDVYRRDAKPARSLLHYLVFLMLFPHSIAGPIFRWKDLEKQLADRTHSAKLAAEGLTRFSLGLAKKVLVANSMAIAADPIFALPREQLGTKMAWIAAIAYTLQIYFDFSGYSDMAIGLGKMAGFSFKENFDAPYVSSSITEFWRRWHISLSTWLRDYLYVPLGGNRGSPSRTLVNVFLVFLLSGFWHGAAWTFVIWGAWHGAWVVLERLEPVKQVRARLPRVVQHALTLLVVVVGWVFFRATTAKGAFAMLAAMSGLSPYAAKEPLMRAEYLPNRTVTMALIGIALSLVPILWKKDPPSEAARAWGVRLATFAAPVLLVLAMAYMANSKFTPLIYFKF